MKRITRRLTVEALSLATACSLVACGSSTSVTTATSAKAAETGSSSANAETKFIPGTYTGSSKGHSGDVTVTATFNENEITDVKLDVSGETESIGQAAADTLKSSILEKQSADFDAVSGATETSDAVKRALQAAIDQATGKGAAAEKTALKDGTYTESV
ncbi:MAG TPA: FMN-binding protein, partial [Oribacterium sp.]|nr:FMN-binding protein [Oribacterium sp.]